MTKQVRIEEKLYRAAKIKAAEQGKTLTEMVSELIRDGLQKESEEPKPSKKAAE